jgi:Ankyrin repeats (many copies)
VIEALLRGGGRVNIQTQYGETPLHCAFSTGRYECILLLLCRGADPSLKEFRGRVPAEVAYSDAEAAGAATPEELVRVQQLQFLMEELPGQLHHVHALLQAADVASAAAAEAAAAEAAADATAADADSTGLSGDSQHSRLRSASAAAGAGSSHHELQHRVDAAELRAARQELARTQEELRSVKAAAAQAAAAAAHRLLIAERQVTVYFFALCVQVLCIGVQCMNCNTSAVLRTWS